MSEHTKGRLHQCEHSDKRLRDNGGKWVADVDIPYRNSEECADNARRIAAVWNNAEGMDTQEIEQGMPLVKVRDTINTQARELNAARALLREVVDMVSSEEYNDTIRKADAYLDAFDTLEGKC